MQASIQSDCCGPSLRNLVRLAPESKCTATESGA